MGFQEDYDAGGLQRFRKPGLQPQRSDGGRLSSVLNRP